MKLTKTILFAIALLYVVSCQDSTNFPSFSLQLLDKPFIVEFDAHGRPVQNTGKCTVEQWAETVHHIVSSSAPGIGHRYVVVAGDCKEDSVLPPMSEGTCCNQRTSRVSYNFKKRCTIEALSKTCGITGSSSASLIQVVLFRQCDTCENGCSPFGYCGLPNPYSNEMPSATLCDQMCQPVDGKCTPRHIFSELSRGILGQVSDEEKQLIENDDDFKDLRSRCATECKQTVDGFACVVNVKPAKE